MRLLKAIFWIGVVALLMPREHGPSARHSAHYRSESSDAIPDATTIMQSSWDDFEAHGESRTVDEFLAIPRARLEARRNEIAEQQHSRQRSHTVEFPTRTSETSRSTSH
jgi:hypothetical protein